MTRQKKWQDKMAAQHRCLVCGQGAFAVRMGRTKHYFRTCKKHAIEEYHRKHKYSGRKRRYKTFATVALGINLDA